MEPVRVEIDLGFFFLMWILFLVTPSISINGAVQARPWGKHQLLLPPGHYTIEAWYPYLFRSRTSQASITLNLVSGASYRLKYRPAWLVFLDGSLTLEAGPALPGATVRQLPYG